jgi:hypothetical protein
LIAAYEQLSRRRAQKTAGAYSDITPQISGKYVPAH